MALVAGERVTFGEAFERGRWPRYAGVRATVGGTAVSAQMDRPSYHPDGSVRHAIFTVVNPGGGSTADIALRPSGAYRYSAGTVTAAVQAILSAGNNVTVEFSGGISTTVNFGALLQSAINAGTLDAWLHGPLVSEFRVRAYVGTNMYVSADIRRYDNGVVSTDILFANDRLLPNGAGGLFHQHGSVSYTAVIKVGGSTVYTSPALTHYPWGQWRKQVWTGTAPVARVLRDHSRWQTDGTIPMIDLTIPQGESYLAQDHSYVVNAQNGPLQPSAWTQSMGTTGMRNDIGYLTAWQAHYLKNRDKRQEWDIMTLADAALGIPWHVRHHQTDWVYTIDEYPEVYATEVDGGGASPGFDNMFTTQWGGWSVDMAHRPQTMYLPYLLTGKRIYHDALMFDAAAILFCQDDYRNGAEGCLVTRQPRGQSWGMTRMMYAQMVSQDRALRKYFANKIDNNFTEWFRYQLIGNIDDVEFARVHIYAPSSAMGGWQNTWLCHFTAQYAKVFGNAQAKTIIEQTRNYYAGRFCYPHKGFNPFYASAYKHEGVGYFPSDGKIMEATMTVTTWAQYNANLVAHEENEDMGGTSFPNNDVDGYTAHARFQLCTAFQVDPHPQYLDAWGFMCRYTEDRFIPRRDGNSAHIGYMQLPDGTQIKAAQIVLPAVGVTTINGHASTSQALIGREQGSTITTGGGNNVAWVEGGNNSITCGAGDNWVICGRLTGNDIVVTGSGNNVIQCGAVGTTRIDFGASSGGADKVYQFSQARGDRLNVLPSLSSAQASALISAATTDTDGNAVLHLASGKDVTLVGHGPGALAPNWFVLS